MAEYVVTTATLDSWPAAKEFAARFNRSIFASRINVDDRTFETMYQIALYPEAMIGVLLLWRMGSPYVLVHDYEDPPRREEQQAKVLTGIAVVNAAQEIVNTQIVSRTFLRGVYIQPGESFRAAVEMDRAIDKWARIRGHDMVYAFVRLNTAEHGNNGFKLRAVQERFGYEPLYQVIGKKLYGEIPSSRKGGSNGQTVATVYAGSDALAGNRADA